MNKVCFVAMPIGSGEKYEVFRNRYEKLIKPAVEKDENGKPTRIRCVRSDLISKPGSITKEILDQLYYADIVIADLSDLNYNVFYELGVRHGLRNKTILIAHKGTSLPFDLKDLRVIWYEDRIGGEDVTIPEIRKFIQSLIQNPGIIDSPVFTAIPELKERFEVETTQIKDEIITLKREVETSRTKITILEDTNRHLRDLLNRLGEPVETILEKLGENERDIAKGRIAEAVTQSQELIPHPRFGTGIKEVDPSTVFVMMPFSPEFDDVYDIIKALGHDHGLNIIRPDVSFATGSIIDGIYDMITRAGLVVADITGRNPNVLYEVGISHTMGKEVILIVRDIHDVPFDVRERQVIIYQNIRDLGKKLNKLFYQYCTKHNLYQ